MKKIVLASLLALTMGAAMADGTTVWVDGQQARPTSGASNSNQLQLGVKQQFNKNFNADFSIANQVTEDSYKQSTRYELGGTGAAPILSGPVDAYVRVAVGERYISGSQGYGYYSVEPGVVYHTPIAGLDAKLGLRYRNSFSDSHESGELTRTGRAAVSYKVTKQDTVGVRYDKVYNSGSNNNDTYGVFYARSF